MIGSIENVKGGELSELCDDRAEERKIGKRVARALEEEHGHCDFVQMVGAFGAWLLRRMQRETEEDDPFDLREKAKGSCLRGHAAPHGFSAGKQRNAGHGLRGISNGSLHGGRQEVRTVGRFAALLHVGKLVAKRGDVGFGQCGGEGFHESMAHPRAGTMSERQKKIGLRGS